MATAMSTQTKRAALYLRISFDKTGEGLGVERQEADARKLVDSRGWTVSDDHVIVENSASASGKKAREGFERLLELITSGEVQVVVAWNLDRLTRNRRDSLRLIETCQEHKITIALCRGSDIDMSTVAGRMFTDFQAAVARGEIETLSEWVSAKAYQNAQEGRFNGGNRPFGYDILTGHEAKQARAAGKPISTIRPDEAEAIRDAFRLVLDGSTLMEVARMWNRAGLQTPLGHPWRGPVVGQTLRKVRLAGLRSLHGQLQRNSDGELIKGEWPAIVDLETWQRAQMLMDDPMRRPATGAQLLLTGIAQCGLCDAGIHSAGARRGQNRYRCAAGKGHVNRLAKPVEDWVVQAILYRLARPDALELFEEASQDQNVAELQAKLRDAQQIDEGLPDLLTTEDETLRLSLDEFKVQRGKVRQRIAELQAQLPATTRRPRAVRSLVTSDDPEASWAGLSKEAQRDIIDALATVTLYPAGPGVTTIKPGQVVIEWKTG
jgi:DNA invertase Pin-like site-specific DNA recombinase